MSENGNPFLGTTQGKWGLAKLIFHAKQKDASNAMRCKMAWWSSNRYCRLQMETKTFHVFRVKQVKSEASTQTVLISPRVGVGIVINSRSVPDGLLAYILKKESYSCWSSTKRTANSSVDAQQSLSTLKTMEVFLGPSSATGPTGRPSTSKFCATGVLNVQSWSGRSSKLPGIQSFWG